jgi:hypothetical protein
MGRSQIMADNAGGGYSILDDQSMGATDDPSDPLQNSARVAR